MNLTFRGIQPEDHADFFPFVHQLYEGDDKGGKMTQAKIAQTIDTLVKQPSAGQVLVVTSGTAMIGYAILIRYWSNEYGGWLIFIDEFFVSAPFRNKGVGAQFMQYVTEAHFDDVVGFALEVMPNNDGALALYKRLGFEEDGRYHLFKKAAPVP